MSRGQIHAYVATAHEARWTGLGLVFVDSRGLVLRRTGRRIPGAAADQAAFRGILYALWIARRLRSRRVVIHSDNADVVGQVNGLRQVDAHLIGPYLQVRALLHAYRSARVDADDMGWRREAGAMAAAALAFDIKRPDVTDVVVEDLPLWSWKDAAERTPA